MSESLAVVDETDLPSILRALMTSVTPKTVARVVAATRQGTRTLSAAATPLVIEVVSTGCRCDLKVARRYLSSLGAEHGGTSTESAPSSWSVVDFLVALGLLQGHTLQTTSQAVLQHAITHGALSVHTARRAIDEFGHCLAPLTQPMLGLLRTLLHQPGKPCHATSAPGLGSPLPHLRWDWAHSFHICAGTGLTASTSAPGLSSPLPHLRRD